MRFTTGISTVTILTDKWYEARLFNTDLFGYNPEWDAPEQWRSKWRRIFSNVGKA